MRKPKITVYRIRVIRRGQPMTEWRWTWKAANGTKIAASTVGYSSRARAIANLRRVTGGSITWGYRHMVPGKEQYLQGHWQRGLVDRIFLEVLP